MSYIFGKFLNKKKLAFVGLKSVFGLGFFQTKILCNKCNIGFDSKIGDLSQNEVVNICKKMDQTKLFFEFQLKNLIKSDIARLITIRCFRGFFHRKIKNVNKK